jgi:hypothetical protein
VLFDLLAPSFFTQLPDGNQAHQCCSIPHNLPFPTASPLLVRAKILTIHDAKLRNRLSVTLDALIVKHMIGDGDHIGFRLAVEIDSLVNRAIAVALRCMAIKPRAWAFR